ncbi:hypothetical protein [Streptomyces sp. NBC_00425]|uniref:hypothetical protein n=1 Tax=Streptomyces sp. NBC_00425 TaxID=2975740 RepID=UPI002E23ED7B
MKQQGWPVSSENWTGHWHGFGPWIGSGQSHKEESRRRPGQGARDPQTELFVRDKRPPMMTGHWLMKTDQVAGTWTSVEDAVAWLQERYEAAPPMVRDDGKAAYVELPDKIRYALDVLPRGVDVTWCYWTQTRMLASYSVVCCRNLAQHHLACPSPPDAISLDTRRNRSDVASALAPA